MHSCTLPRLQLGLLSRWPPNPPSGCSLLQVWVLYLQIPLAAQHPGVLQHKFLNPDSTKQPPSCRGWASAHHAPVLSHLGLSHLAMSNGFILAAEKGCFLPRDMILGQTQACVSLYTQDEPCSLSHRRNLMLFHPGAFRDWPGLRLPPLPTFQPWCQVQAPATEASLPSSSPVPLPGAATLSPNSWRIRLPEVFFFLFYTPRDSGVTQKLKSHKNEMGAYLNSLLVTVVNQ